MLPERKPLPKIAKLAINRQIKTEMFINKMLDSWLNFFTSF